jgi:hypothetical protein
MVDYFVLDVDRNHPPRGRVGYVPGWRRSVLAAFLVATIAFLVATIARWWTIKKRHQPKKSTAWPRWLPDVGLDDQEATSTEEIHRVAAVAT